MALAALAGDWGARVLSVVFFDVYFLFAIPGLISGSASPDIVLGVSLELTIGLAAIILLWRPASSQFFSAARQARTATRS